MFTAVGDAEGFVERGVAFFLHPAPEFHAEQGWIGDATNAVGAASQRRPVVQEYPDDLAKPEGYDGQIIPPQPEYRKAQHQTEQGGKQSTDRQCQPERNAGVLGEQGKGVGAHGVECHVAKIQKSGQTDHDVQAKGQHHIDQHQCGQIHGTAGHEEGPE